MTMPRALALAALPLAAQAADCAFDAECVEDEPCAETAYAARIVGPGAGMTGPATLVDDAGSVALEAAGPGVWVGGDGRGAYAGRFGAMMLTTGEDGTARLTVHFTEGPMAITYLGTCEVPS